MWYTGKRPLYSLIKRKSRAAHPCVGSHFDPLRETADKAGLAGAELTDQANDLAALN